MRVTIFHLHLGFASNRKIDLDLSETWKHTASKFNSVLNVLYFLIWDVNNYCLCQKLTQAILQKEQFDIGIIL